MNVLNTDLTDEATEIEAETDQTDETLQGDLDTEGEEETVETEATDGTEVGDPDEVDAEADGETEEIEEEPIFEVETVNGKEKFKLSQLTESVMLKADHTKKTMELSEYRKSVESLEQELSQTKSQLSEALTYWAVPQEQEPNWAQLAETTDAKDLFLLKDQWQTRMKLKEEATVFHQQMQMQEAQKRAAVEQQKLFESFPEWKKPEVLAEQTKRLRVGGGDYGFSSNEIDGIADHRMIRVMHDAIKYRELQKAQAPLAKKLSTAPKKLPAGAKPTKTQGERQKLDAQLQKLRGGMRSGDVEATTEYMRLKRLRDNM